MSGIRLDDFLSKKKEVAQVLDLSKSVARTKEDLKKLLDKVPEFKSKAEKIRADDIKIRDKDWTFKPTKKELRYVADFTFANPVPADMRPVKLEDLISVPIDWRMLTTLRPKTKLDEEFFSRLIELGKLARATLQYERQREGPRSTYAATSSSWVKRFKTRSGVVETKATTCSQCGDEFCDSTACKLFTYDCFVRTSMLPAGTAGAGGSGDAAKDKSGSKAGDKGGKERGRGRKKKRRGVRSAAKSAKAASSQPPSRRGSPSKKSARGGRGRGRDVSRDMSRDSSQRRSRSAPPAASAARRGAARSHTKSAKK